MHSCACHDFVYINSRKFGSFGTSSMDCYNQMYRFIPNGKPESSNQVDNSV